MQKRSRAEERAWEAYPSESHWFNENRAAYVKGYEQAEEDLTLTWQDIQRIVKIADQMVDEDEDGRLLTMGEEEYYKEVLQLFKEGKV